MSSRKGRAALVSHGLLVMLLSDSLLYACDNFRLSYGPRLDSGNLTKADLTGAHPETAKLRGAILTYADQEQVKYANLTAANIKGANLGEPYSV